MFENLGKSSSILDVEPASMFVLLLNSTLTLDQPIYKRRLLSKTQFISLNHQFLS